MPSPLRRLALAAAAAGLVTLSTAPLAIAAPFNPFNPFAPRPATPSAGATPPATPIEAPVADGRAVPAGASPSNVSWPQRPMKSSEAMTSPCADVLFVSARASLQRPGYGAALRGVRNDIKGRFATTGATTVREAWLEYPAAFPTAADWATDALAMTLSPRPPKNAYASSVERGRQNLLRLLDDSATRCPHERVMLVGYSQGAQVVTEALASRRHDDRLLGAVLLGSPLNLPGRSVTRSGTADEHAVGIISMLNYSRTYTVAGQKRTSSTSGPWGEALRASQGELDPGRMAKAAHDGIIGDEHGEASALRAELESARTHQPLAPYDNLDERTESVCLESDWVCDSVGASARAGTLQRDAMSAYHKAFTAHLGYTPRVWRPAVERMATGASARYATPSAQAAPAAMPVPVPAAAEDIGSQPPIPVGTQNLALPEQSAAQEPSASAPVPDKPTQQQPTQQQPTRQPAQTPAPEAIPAPPTPSRTPTEQLPSEPSQNALPIDPRTRGDVVWAPRTAVTPGQPPAQRQASPSTAPAMPLVPSRGQQERPVPEAARPGEPGAGQTVRPEVSAPHAGTPPERGDILPEHADEPKAALNSANRESPSVVGARTAVPAPPLLGLGAGAMGALALGAILFLRRGGLGF